MSRRAVITGCGVVSALGSDARATWDALVAGRVGIGPVTLFDTTRERTHTAAEIQGLPELSIPSGRQRRRASRSDRMAFLASGQAIEDAGLDLERVDRRRAGLLLGGGSALLEGEAFLGAMLAAERRSPSRALGFFPATSADAVASHYGLSGEVDTLLTACSSATIAIGLAAMRVMSGAAEVMLAGGVETLSRATYSGFNSLRL
ncbi:MAG TPA: beta-ketoacyl synthase N-terminal-like domain-containing protein, partial [Candidatus Polarisedimenticolia bacterium]